MAAPRTKQAVMQDDRGIWLSARLAMQRTGLTWRALRDLAFADAVRNHGEAPNGDPLWFHEEDITAMVKAAAAEAAAQPPPKPKRPLTDAQLEAMHTRQWKAEAKTRRSKGSALETHSTRVLLWEPEKKKD